jgi:O-Antigen ligase
MDLVRAAATPELTEAESSQRLGLTRNALSAWPVVAITGAFGAVVATAHVAWPMAGIISAVSFAALVAFRPGWFLALAMGGFYVYVAALDLANHSPRTVTTMSYYALLCIALLCVVARGLPVIVGRLHARIALTATWLAAAIWLAVWFTTSVVVFSGSETAYRFLGVFILLTVPATLALLGFSHENFAQLRNGLTALAIGVAVADILALIAGRGAVNFRFSPFESLDYINASIVPAVGAIALLSDLRQEVWSWFVQVLVSAGLIAACILAGGRGALISVGVTLVTMAILGRRRILVGVVVAIAVGATAGAIGASQIGTTQLPSIRSLLDAEQVSTTASERPMLLSVGPTAQKRRVEPSATLAPEPISSTRMRREWILESFRGFRDRPIAGHGVAQLVNTTDDARRLGTYGERIWPHNDVAEAAHALGLLGLVPFVLLAALPVVAIIRMRRFGVASSIYLFSVGLYIFAMTQSNFSGEIGTDVFLWGAGAMVVGIYADWRAALDRDRRAGGDGGVISRRQAAA